MVQDQKYTAFFQKRHHTGSWVDVYLLQFSPNHRNRARRKRPCLSDPDQILLPIPRSFLVSAAQSRTFTQYNQPTPQYMCAYKK